MPKKSKNRKIPPKEPLSIDKLLTDLCLSRDTNVNEGLDNYPEHFFTDSQLNRSFNHYDECSEDDSEYSLCELDSLYPNKESLKIKNPKKKSGKSNATESRKLYTGPSDILQPAQLDLEAIWSDIRTSFLESTISEEYSLPPMAGPIRELFHKIAYALNVKSSSYGSGLARHITFRKKANWSINSKAISKAYRLVLRASKLQSTPHAKVLQSTRPAIGTVVGEDAPPIEESNIGSVLLRKLGWEPGSAIGVNSEASKDPIQIVVRRKRAGLGTK